MRRSVKRVLDRLYSTYNVGNSTPTTPKPYLILRFDTPIESVTIGRFTCFSVILLADPGNPLQLDTMTEVVVKALDGVQIARIGDGSVFVPEYNGYTNDFPDDTLKALTKEIRFKVPAFGNEVM